MFKNTNPRNPRDPAPFSNSDSSHTITSDSTLKNDPPGTDSPATIRGDNASSPATIRGDNASSPATIRGDDASSPATIVGDEGNRSSRHSNDELLAAEALVELSRVERVFR
ncbi:hypothetical protein XANCAGTX0491_005499 [Xanthoria calcicola]